MKKSKKIAALVLTTAMAAGGMTSVYAAGAVGETAVEGTSVVEKIETNADGSIKGTDMLLTGTIKVTNLSVTIPTTVSFNVDMTKTPVKGAATKADINVQVQQPAESVYKIINNSASSVWVYVTGVTPAANGGALPVLTNRYDNVKTKDNNLMFAIKDTAEPAPALGGTYDDAKKEPGEIGTAGFWMTTDGINSTNKKYSLNSTTNGELIAKDLAVAGTGTEGKNEMPLTIYAFTRKGWKAGDKFNVTPVFTVSVEAPEANTP